MAIRRKTYKGIYTDENAVFVCDTEADVASLPTECPAGSSAFVIETSRAYMINTSGIWNEIEIGDGGGGEVTLTTLNISGNGTYNAPGGKAYKKVIADVAGNGSQSVVYDSETNVQAAAVTNAKGDEVLRDLTVGINPVQNLHGYDSPWPAGGGKNLLDTTKTYTGISYNGNEGITDTPTVNENTWTDNHDGTFSNTLASWAPACFLTKLLPAGDYHIHIQETAGTTRYCLNVYDASFKLLSKSADSQFDSETYDVNRTLTESGYICIGLWGYTSPQTIKYPQVEVGSAFTSYAPYSNICPITGWTGAKVTRCGKNLFDLIVYNGGAYNPEVGRQLTLTVAPDAKQFADNHDGTFTVTMSAQWVYYTLLFRQAPGVQYRRHFSIPYTDGRRFSILLLDQDFKVLSVSNYAGTQDYTFDHISTAYDGVTYYAITLSNGSTANSSITISEPMIEIAPGTGEYEPYSGQTYPISWQSEAGTVYGGTLDVTTGVLMVTWAIEDMGDLTWNSGYGGFYTGIKVPVIANETPNILCSSYKTDSYNQRTDYDISAVYGGPTYAANGTIVVKDPRYITQMDFKAAVDGVQMCYELAEPIEYLLTPVQISMLTGYNAIMADCGSVLNMEYRAETHSYIDAYLPVDTAPYAADGKTHIWIRIDDDTPASRRTFPLSWSQSVSNGVTVKWGDGSAAETFSGTGADTHTHTYASGGGYEITLEVTDGTVSFDTTEGTSGTAIYGPKANAYSYNRERITCVVLGDNVSAVGNYMLQYCYGIKYITIPSGIQRIGNGSFYNCYSLVDVYIPNSVTSIGNNAFYYCFAMESVRIPNGVTAIGDEAFYNCYSLKSIEIPNGVTVLNQYVLHGCHNLTSVSIPSGVTQIGAGALDSCYGLTKLTIPSSVTSIGASAFSNCYGIKEYHMQRTTPPTLSGTSAFTGIASDCVIYVPYSADHSVLNAYKSATNWATYAAKMQEEAQA